MTTQKISIVLPSYNEKEGIIPLVDAIHEQLKDNDHEILVVDDDSPDGTYGIIVDANLPYLKGILRKSDKGFANSIRCGIENSVGDIIIIMDSDFNHKPEYLPFMVDTLAHYPCVVASRFVYGGKMDTWWRHLLSWVFNIWVRIMTGGKITDSLYGYIAVRRSVLEQMDFNKIFWGYGDYCIRFMYYMQQNEVSVLQFPAVNGKRISGEGNSNFFKVFTQYFKAVIKLFIRERI